MSGNEDEQDNLVRLSTLKSYDSNRFNGMHGQHTTESPSPRFNPSEGDVALRMQDSVFTLGLERM